MEIKVENKGAFDLTLTDELFDGNRNIIEVTEAPTGMGTGMVAWRCVSKGKASPVTAKLKCPLWKGKRY
jgi:hypothetical protein